MADEEDDGGYLRKIDGFICLFSLFVEIVVVVVCCCLLLLFGCLKAEYIANRRLWNGNFVMMAK